MCVCVCVCAPVKPKHPIDFQERSADLFDLRISNLALELVPPKQLTPSALKAYKAADAFNFSGRGATCLRDKCTGGCAGKLCVRKWGLRI